MRAVTPEQPCPCGRDRPFGRCCQPLHAGAMAPDPEALMRARYSAYAVGDVAFLIATTDPEGPHHDPNRKRWARELRASCRATDFTALRVDGVGIDAATRMPTVRFFASATRGGRDASFGEVSRFRSVGGRWMYVDGGPWSPRH